MTGLLVLALFALAGVRDSGDGVVSSGSTDDAAVDVYVADSHVGGSAGNAVAVRQDLVEYGNFYMCSNGQPMAPGTECIGGDNISPHACAEGSSIVPPRWRREATSVDPLVWGPWRVVRGLRCAEDSQISFEDALRVAWEQMPIAPHEIRLQPDTGWVYASVPTVGMVDREPRQISTVLLGRDVLIRALPVSMRWEWGHGQPTVTSDLGAPYPNHTVSHTYAYFEGDVTVGVTTTWSGQYSLNGGASWLPAPGVATTTSTPVPLTVYNPHAHVVACDVGSC